VVKQSKFKQTPSQTVGPFFAYGLSPTQYQYNFDSMITDVIEAAGEAIVIKGFVYDGNLDLVDDALIEIWQADSKGRFDGDDFLGFARSGTGSREDSSFEFQTIKPGSIGPGQAPYISVIVLMRGLMMHGNTRLYFSDEAEANQQDIILSQIPEDRKPTLIAQRTDSEGLSEYLFNIHMQGDKETLFFDI